VADAGPHTGRAPAGPRPALRWLPPALRRPEAAPLAVCAAGLAGAGYLYVTDPHEPGHVLPGCPFRFVTGLLCPACGGTRMVYDLMHGRFGQAWLDNRMLLLAAPFALALLARWGLEGLRGRRWRPRLRPRTQVLILLLAVAWTVARNVR